MSSAATTPVRQPAWMPTALCVQLVLAFFAPPIVWGTRHVIPADLWCALWLAATLADRSVWRTCGRFFATTATLIAVAYLHGYFRPSVLTELTNNFLFQLKETDTFQGGRELVVALRFLGWLWALRVASLWRPSAVVARTLAACLTVSGALTALDLAWRPARLALGEFYKFDPAFQYWATRAYGPFGSPIEAGVALAFGILLVARVREVSRRWRVAAILAAMAGLACTKTFTAMGALLAALVIVWILQHRRSVLRLPRWVLVSGAVSALAAIVAAFAFTSIYRSMRFNDLVGRALAWRVYFEAALLKPDCLLFGMGFAPYHTDNAYIFLFSRGGLLALGAFAYQLWHVVRARARHWNRADRAAVLFLLVAGLAVDDFIFRHIVYMMIGFGVSKLSHKERPR